MSGVDGLLRAQGVLLGLIVLMTGVFFAQVLGPAGWDDPMMAVPTDVVTAWQHLRSGSTTGSDWQALGSLLSCAFLHGSPDHLFGNLVFYWIFGGIISELLGWRWLLAMVVVTALGASATHVALNRDDAIPMLGASGVVSGFMGAYVAMAVRWHLPDPHIWPMARPVPPVRLAILAAVFVALDYKELISGSPAMVAYGAHVGGFTTGLFVAGLLTPRPAAASPRNH